MLFVRVRKILESLFKELIRQIVFYALSNFFKNALKNAQIFGTTFVARATFFHLVNQAKNIKSANGVV